LGEYVASTFRVEVLATVVFADTLEKTMWLIPKELKSCVNVYIAAAATTTTTTLDRNVIQKGTENK
jgi:hypothetical protein